MKSLIITGAYPPEISSGANLIQGIARGLQERGNEVFVLTRFPGHYLADKDGADGLAELSEEDGIKIIRVRSWIPDGKNLITGSISAVLLSLTLFRKARKYLDGGVDEVIVFSPPLALAVTGGLIKKKYGARFILNLQDIFPQSDIDLGLLKNETAIRFFKRMEKTAYHEADTIVVNSEGGKQFLTVKKGVPEWKINVVPAVLAVSGWDAPAKVDFRREFGLKNKFIFLFSGIMSSAQGLPFLISVAQRLKRNDDIVFLLVGDGPEKGNIRSLVEESILFNVIFKDFVPAEDYPSLLKSADVGLICLSSESKLPFVPGKFFDFLAAGKPILAILNKGNDGFGLVRDAQCGVSVEAGDLEAAEKAIRAILAENKSELLAAGENGRRYAKEHFEKNIAGAKLEELLGVKAKEAQRDISERRETAKREVIENRVAKSPEELAEGAPKAKPVEVVKKAEPIIVPIVKETISAEKIIEKPVAETAEKVLTVVKSSAGKVKVSVESFGGAAGRFFESIKSFTANAGGAIKSGFIKIGRAVNEIGVAMEKAEGVIEDDAERIRIRTGIEMDDAETVIGEDIKEVEREAVAVVKKLESAIEEDAKKIGGKAGSALGSVDGELVEEIGILENKANTVLGRFKILWRYAGEQIKIFTEYLGRKLKKSPKAEGSEIITVTPVKIEAKAPLIKREEEVVIAESGAKPSIIKEKELFRVGRALISTGRYLGKKTAPLRTSIGKLASGMGAAVQAAWGFVKNIFNKTILNVKPTIDGAENVIKESEEAVLKDIEKARIKTVIELDETEELIEDDLEKARIRVGMAMDDVGGEIEEDVKEVGQKIGTVAVRAKRVLEKDMKAVEQEAEAVMGGIENEFINEVGIAEDETSVISEKIRILSGRIKNKLGLLMVPARKAINNLFNREVSKPEKILPPKTEYKLEVDKDGELSIKDSNGPLQPQREKELFRVGKALLAAIGSFGKAKKSLKNKTGKLGVAARKSEKNIERDIREAERRAGIAYGDVKEIFKVEIETVTKESTPVIGKLKEFAKKAVKKTAPVVGSAKRAANRAAEKLRNVIRGSEE